VTALPLTPVQADRAPSMSPRVCDRHLTRSLPLAMSGLDSSPLLSPPIDSERARTSPSLASGVALETT
jgi:hypothetical protein